MSKGAAYKESGLGEKNTQRTCYNYGSQLANEKACIERVAEIQEAAKAKAKEDNSPSQNVDMDEWLTAVMMGNVEDRGQPARLAERLKAAELKCKINGLMSNKTEVTGDIEIEVSISHAED
jgi:hypothetical protein